MINSNDNNIYNDINNFYNMDGQSWREVLSAFYNSVDSIENSFKLIETKFDINLPVEVKNEIIRMKNDGSLATVINQEVFGNLDKKIDNTDKKLSEQLADIVYKDNYILNKLFNNQSIDFALIGESIVSGNGSTGWKEPTTSADGTKLLFNDGTKDYYEAVYTCPSWANQFRTWATAKGCTLTNFGIGGMSTKWFNARRNLIFTSKKDVVIIQLGTNDRWDCVSKAEFISTLEDFLSYVKSNCNHMIVMIPNPVNGVDESTFKFTQMELRDILIRVCRLHNYNIVDNYGDMLEYVSNRALTLSKIIKDGTHPNDDGHKFYWRNIQNKLGITDYSSNYNVIEPTDGILIGTFGQFNQNTPVSQLPKGKIIYQHVSTSQAIEGGYPSGKAGTLIIDNTYGGFGYCTQEYKIYREDVIYTSTSTADNTWTAWKENKFIKINTDVITVQTGTIQANSSISVDVVCNIPIYFTKPLVVMPTKALSANFLWSWYIKNGTTLTFNFTNTGSTSLGNGDIQFKLCQIDI